MISEIRLRGPGVDVQTLLKVSVDEFVQRTLRADDDAVAGRACSDEIVSRKRDVLLRGSLEAFTGKRFTITRSPLDGYLVQLSVQGSRVFKGLKQRIACNQLRN